MICFDVTALDIHGLKGKQKTFDYEYNKHTN